MEKVFTSKPVDEATYDKYMKLKFVEMNGAILKPDDVKILNELEIEIKTCSGRVAKRSVRAAIGGEQFRMIEGMPVPESFVAVFRKAGSEDYYLQPQ